MGRSGQTPKAGDIRACATLPISMPEETMTLAPAAGAGIGKILAERLLADPTFVDAMVDAVMNGLRATRTYFVKGQTEPISEPDSKTQLHAFALVLAHMEGEPIKRIIHQHLGGTGAVDPLAALQDSPALREAAGRLLEKANWRTSGKQAHKAPKRAEAATPEPTPAGGF